MRHLVDPFYADARSIVAFRVCLGLLTAFDALWLLSYGNAEGLLSDRGVLPLSVLHSAVSPPHKAWWSLHAMSPHPLVTRSLLALQLVLALGLAAGHRPRPCALLCWALVLSVINRNPLAHHGGDDLLRMELLLASLAPLDTVCGGPVARGPATAMLLLQPALVYAMAGATKCGDSWQVRYSAVDQALSWRMAAKPLASTILSWPAATRAASAVTPHLELFAPTLLLCPLSAVHAPARTLGVCVLFLLQVRAAEHDAHERAAPKGLRMRASTTTRMAAAAPSLPTSSRRATPFTPLPRPWCRSTRPDPAGPPTTARRPPDRAALFSRHPRPRYLPFRLGHRRPALRACEHVGSHRLESGEQRRV